MSEINIPVCFGVQGMICATVRDKFGNIKQQLEWFPNVITDAGLNSMATNSPHPQCHIGTGTATPAVTDSAYSNVAATATSVFSSTSGVTTTAPYYGYTTQTWRFAAGAGTGNLTDVWFGTATVPFSHALFKDSNGNPVTITKTAEDSLDVTYQRRVYVPTEDVVVPVTVNGVAAGSATIRAARCAESTYWSGSLAAISMSSNMWNYSGTLGAITGTPSGTVLSMSSANWTYVATTYVANSLSRTWNVTWGLTQGNNATGGFRSIVHTITGLGTFQVEFPATLNKVSTNVLTYSVTATWSRYAG
ncbi:hypothetical protein [Ideonella livida]|uniref:Uncharacterized protein n=1 Tax=Ideonella livida TaxID=2707176 RepID=A0A7C9PEY0_9BURK|nr:hypothetical protein [Ideonella livida]NDY89732.1 hypothetical protein [Ideonella livida]